ncbi:conserved hypothetical protein [Ricinus communis]|uniref:DUF4283 domain-containing protein n=1 Tax=Ricinus communis TaxID=3988 RepID=B9S5F7_RICCO|nr:conserved hypothetical protein [Ricinus communis]
MEGAPWSVSNSLTILVEWLPDTSLEWLKFDKCPFWVKVYHLALDEVNIQSAQ